MTQHYPQGSAPQRMFGAQAAAYATSQVHVSDDRLTAVRRLAVEWAAGNGGNGGWVIDLGTGAGFTAFAVADCCRQVLASDITRPMLEQTRRLGRERQVSNLSLSQNRAEALPIASESVDLVTCRAAGHHFTDLGAALDEIRRILKPGGALIMADSVAPDDAALHAWLNDVEVRRDYSHIENRPVSVLLQMLADRNLTIQHQEPEQTRMTFNDWVARTATPEAEVATLRRDFRNASPQVKEAFEIQETADGNDFSFAWPCLIFRAVKE